MSMNLVTEGSFERQPLHAGVLQSTPTKPAEGEYHLVIVDPRVLARECLAGSIRAFDDRFRVTCFGSFSDWEKVKERVPAASAILLSLADRKISDPAVAEELKKRSDEGQAPVIMLTENDNLPQILDALALGIRGFIPPSADIGVCVEAVRLTVAGGTFIPASSVLGMRETIEASHNPANHLSSFFTLRQAEVAEAIRRGKANKIIAYELKLRESTVKVHIRNIMRKLNASNRTEVAFKINDLFPNAH